MGKNVDKLEPVNVAVAVFALLLSPEIADVVGPYAIILIASSVGAGWALGRRDASAKLGAFGYFLRLNFTAMIVTVGIASLLGRWLGHSDPTWMLGPIALLIGGVGDDWPRLIDWAGRFFIRKKFGASDKGDGV